MGNDIESQKDKETFINQNKYLTKRLENPQRGRGSSSCLHVSRRSHQCSENYSLISTKSNASKNINGKSNILNQNLSKQIKSTMKIRITAKDVTFPSEEGTYMQMEKQTTLDQSYKNKVKLIFSKHPLFKQLTDSFVQSFLNSMIQYSIKANAVISKLHSTLEYLYVVVQGKCSLILNEPEQKEIILKEVFGDWEILNSSELKGTIICKEDSIIWVCPKNKVQEYIQIIRKNNIEDISKYINNTLDILDKEKRKVIIQNINVLEYNENDIITNGTDQLQSLFLNRKGTVLYKKDSEIIGTIDQGKLFGCSELYQSLKSKYEAIAKSNCRLFALSYECIKTILGSNYILDLTAFLVFNSFEHSYYFKHIKKETLRKLPTLFKHKFYRQGDIIFKRGEDINKSIAILLDGSIYNSKSNKIEASSEEIINEKEIYNENTILITNDIIAYNNCIVAYSELSKVQKTIRGKIKEIVTKGIKVKLLKSSLFFQYFPIGKIDEFEKEMVYEKYEDNTPIFRQGEAGDKLYLIKSGRVDFFVNAKYVRSRHENQTFGERSLYLKEKRSATAITYRTVELYSLQIKNMSSLFTPGLNAYIKEKIALEDSSIELRDLDNVKPLGKGSFGFVNLVKYKKNNQSYAIKAIHISTIDLRNMYSYVEQEKNVLLKLDHPFIVKLVKILKRDQYIFFLFEYVNGKSLYNIIKELEILNKHQTQFYIASLITVMNYLHSRGIVHRDIKPDNVMINENGWVKVIDFGIVKEIKNNKTWTVIGTPGYMAPEVIRGESYGFEVDFWSIGICLYECYCGKKPFGDETKDPIEIYKAVLNNQLAFPSFVHDTDFKTLVSKLLDKSNERLTNCSLIQREEWFNDFNWKGLTNRTCVPPYKPFDNINPLNYRINIDKGGSISYMSFIDNHKIVKKQSVLNKGKTPIDFQVWFDNF